MFDIFSKPDEPSYGSLQKPGDSGMKKSESQFSLDWDAALEQARQEALAPDRVPLVYPAFSLALYVNCTLIGSMSYVS